MFFSAKQLHDYLTTTNQHVAYLIDDFEGVYRHNRPVTLGRVKRYVKACKKAIVERKLEVEDVEGYAYLGKWLRPWDVVPSLRNFSAPAGEYAVGIEIEMGFNSQADASFIASKVSNWKNIALDYEGGRHPIEATFPPILYSKLSCKAQPFRYLKLLQQNLDKVYEHSPGNNVGTHVNVSKGGMNCNDNRVREMSHILGSLNRSECSKYFGRERPYGYCYSQGRYVEFKLFNSTTDPKVLRRYVHVAVALADIIYGDARITASLVRTALSTAYNKR